MRISSCTFKGFPPFADATIDFPEKEAGFAGAEVHFLVGQNGAGKTRLLSLLAAALGNRAELNTRLGEPQPKDFKSVVQAGPSKEGTGAWFSVSGNDRVARRTAKAKISIPEDWLEKGWDSPSFQINSVADNWLNLADEPMFALAFNGLSRMHDSKIEALKSISFGKPQSHLLFTTPSADSDFVAQSYANLKIQAAMTTGQAEFAGISRWNQMCEKLESTISLVTGRGFNLVVTPYPKIELIINWGGVKMKLSQAPDGLRSLLGWLAACVGKLDVAFPEHPDPLSIPGVLLIDEPEGHLHPSWQRNVLPATQKLLPNAQIFTATHSPFVISSVNHGWIHVLRQGKDGVVVDKARPCESGDSYLDVVEDILGVKEWYDPETEQMLATFRSEMNLLLAGDSSKESSVREKAEAIGSRSPALSEIMRRELGKLKGS